MFVVTGSQQFSLNQAITQSLAGRTALIELLPLSIVELMAAGFDLSLNDYILHGCFPRIYKDHLSPTKTYRFYYQTYLERDVRQLINVKDLISFQRFIKLCAGRIGQILEVSNLANEAGVSSHTVKHWLSILEASYLIFRLPPYFENLGKRFIKSPKLYFTDVGLAAYLLGITDLVQIDRDPLRGALVENLVIVELLKTLLNHGLDHELYFYRDQQKNEIDVILKRAHQLIPIEIKAGQTMQTEFLKGLRYFNKLVGERCEQGYLIYSGKDEFKVDKFKILNYKNCSQAVLPALDEEKS